MQYQRHRLSQHGEMQQIDLALTQADDQVAVQGIGNGPIAATVNAIEPALQVVHFEERAQSVGSDAQAVAVIELRDQQTGQQAFGVGVHGNSSTAAVMAVVSAGARLGVRVV
jgi:2-isopropylmalate synthase